ncbi:Lrp/AsnC family transcriptional regulator [Rhodanobacter aciditrophus]|uniref:Lrp/AsnC family transcriptional regulator n=1 Tax=Rhodanobacter aciditrophus TaxID=1623218 RepID=A0ABW4AYA1_9GAMM
MHLDDTDLQLLALIQSDDSISIESMANQVGLSKTPCWRRVQKLENAGYIKRRVALLDAEKFGLGVSVFVQVKTNQHDVNWSEKFARVVSEFPEVMEFYRMAGEYDYLLRVLVKDIPAYDQFYKRLISATALTDVTSNFAMEQIKWTTQLPLPTLPKT